jgi:hypothetical protein
MYNVALHAELCNNMLNFVKNLSVFQGSILCKGKIFLLSIASRLVLGPTQPSIQRIPEALSSGVKQQGRETDHPSPSSAEIMNGGAISPLPIRLYGMVLSYLSTGPTLPLPRFSINRHMTAILNSNFKYYSIPKPRETYDTLSNQQFYGRSAKSPA